MLSHDEMIGLQAEKHDLIDADHFRSKEQYVLHLIHTFAYINASRFCEQRRVLDFGCNTGYGSNILSQSAKEVVGVDVSANALSLANKHYGHFGIRFEQIDGKTLPFEQDQFDMIVCCQVIEHIVNHVAFIGEIKRVLAPRGIVFFTTPNAALRLDPGMKPWNIFHVREFSHPELTSVLEAFFATTRLWGLYAKEPLYSIEINRLTKAREQAKSHRESDHSRSLHSPHTSIISLIKQMLPARVSTQVKRIAELFLNNKSELDMAFITQYGINDFYYSDTGLDTALDLLAICSDGAIDVEQIGNQYLKTV